MGEKLRITRGVLLPCWPEQIAVIEVEGQAEWLVLFVDHVEVQEPKPPKGSSDWAATATEEILRAIDASKGEGE